MRGQLKDVWIAFWSRGRAVAVPDVTNYQLGRQYSNMEPEI